MYFEYFIVKKLANGWIAGVLYTESTSKLYWKYRDLYFTGRSKSKTSKETNDPNPF